ncbi:hypothetical protein LR48_Vigan10g115600 [Vigna angularis]|uniref:Uncharacterized protein n=1 Tax=Phaseolus angularis TaxID=3914 RepID=A0A0L9VKK5_PHAAN|nr:hypothetical protein LR48_Vigan10g115600 [Vigna angularis]
MECRARLFPRGSRPGTTGRASGATFADVSDPAYLTLKREGVSVFGSLEARFHVWSSWRARGACGNISSSSFGSPSSSIFHVSWPGGQAPTDGGGGAVAEYKLLLEEDVADESEASVLHC